MTRRYPPKKSIFQNPDRAAGFHGRADKARNGASHRYSNPGGGSGGSGGGGGHKTGCFYALVAGAVVAVIVLIAAGRYLTGGLS
jgi:hypothetical protein